MDFKGFFDKVKSGVDKAKNLVTGGEDADSPPEPVGASQPPKPAHPRPDAPTGSGSASSHGKPLSTSSYNPVDANRSAAASDQGSPMPGMAQRQRGVPEGQSAGKAPLIQNETEDTVYMKRAAQVNRIEAMFGEHGPRVCSYLLSQSLTPGGITRVVKKLGLESRGREGADLAVVEKFLTQNGADVFCKAVGLRLAGDGPPPAPMPPNSGTPSDSGNPAGLRVRMLDMASQGGAAEGSGNAAALRARMNPPPPPGPPPMPPGSGAPSDSGGAAALRARMNPQLPGAPPPPPPPPTPRQDGTGPRPSKLDQSSTVPSSRNQAAQGKSPNASTGGASHVQKIDVKPINLSESRNESMGGDKAEP